MASGRGATRWHWDGRDDLGRELASGVYLYRMEPESRWTGTVETAVAAMILDSAEGASGWLGLANKLLPGQPGHGLAKSDTPAQAMNEQPYSLASVSWTCEVIGPYSVAAG